MPPSAVHDVPFISVICSYPTREDLCMECPALLLLLYRHVVAELQSGRRPVDVFRGSSRQDHVSELLSMTSLAELSARLYVSPPNVADTASSARFWKEVKATLEAAWASAFDAKAQAFLVAVRGQPRFHFDERRDKKSPGEGLPLHPVTLERALTTSKRFLRTATTCALEGSTDPLGGKQPELSAVLQLAHLVLHSSPATPASPSSTKGTAKEVTPEGLNFCMVSLQQRWWLLVNAALERVLLLARSDSRSGGSAGGITKPLLWQLLAVLAVLDTSQFMFAFPEKAQDAPAHQLLARLSEIGLVYPLLSEGQKCFVVSPDFLHALHWNASAPLSLTFNQQLIRSHAEVDNVAAVRREDDDTIITETNFRLYAYTRDPDLLNILNQFADLEEVVNENLYCYRVTRDSFAAAVRKGITATQILRFLSLRAHPSMLRRYGGEGQVTPDAPASHLAPLSSSVSRHAGVMVATATESSSAVDSVATLVVPDSFCDQLRMWERECRRVIFDHHVVLLRSVTTEQQKAVAEYLTEAGEADAVVYSEPGYMVLREDVFDLLILPLLSSGQAS